MPLPLAQTTVQPIFAQAQQSRSFATPITLLKYWHLASLDAPTVAVAWTLVFAWMAHVHLPTWVPVLIGLAVWSVYVGDRILDARSGLRACDTERLRERHFFHWRHRRVLASLASVAAVAAACIIFVLMPVTSRQRDSFLAAASLLYFMRVHNHRSAAPIISKEFLVGLLFTIGCVLPTFSRTAASIDRLVPASLFMLLAWLNCQAIECWESADRVRARQSVAKLADLLALAGIVLATALAMTQPRAAALTACASLSAVLFALVDRRRNRIPAITLRAVADLVLLTPVLLVPIAPLFR